ncbi:hypothetical protein WEU38_11275 [Cyanobacterium aponinum AL20118]|uniref:Uncharacterized protein n=2 Tax=Cyanobacterium aponinum TaxID=379064 RepID=A0A844GLP3_9CHRO|nr:hypothetical protein [Cyanobacterium aponinum]MTF37494.1 hypothetical protein [Cyanobacterium aponinum 0216]PHV63769.1 hypothetical protein CSQ80_04150 [Cyanobacterium aponinum IPPAS B-1201]WPF87393.1 hypothetical protein SAY89_11305 [Cyanobacterium aponinum AL20115]
MIEDYTDIPEQDEDELMQEEGEAVYSFCWDTGTLGAGADCELIYLWKGQYVVCLSYDSDRPVYSSLIEAIMGAELNFVNDSTTEIESSELSSEQIIELLETDIDSDVHELTINGEDWEVDKQGNFTRIVYD